MGDLKGDPHIFQDVVFGLVAGAVAINDQGGSAFLKRTAERVHTRHCERHGLHNSRRAPLLGFLIGMKIRFRHDSSPQSIFKPNTAALRRRGAGKADFVKVTPLLAGS